MLDIVQFYVTLYPFKIAVDHLRTRISGVQLAHIPETTPVQVVSWRTDMQMYLFISTVAQCILYTPLFMVVDWRPFSYIHHGATEAVICVLTVGVYMHVFISVVCIPIVWYIINWDCIHVFNLIKHLQPTVDEGMINGSRSTAIDGSYVVDLSTSSQQTFNSTDLWTNSRSNTTHNDPPTPEPLPGQV